MVKRNKLVRVTYVCAFLLLAVFLTACGGNSDVVEDEPQQYEQAQSTEPNPNPAATPEPTTADTDDLACEHEWRDANFQQPKQCLICGEVEGDRLIGYFEENGIVVRDVVIREEIPYITVTSGNPNIKTQGLFRVTIMDIFARYGGALLRNPSTNNEVLVLYCYSLVVDDNIFPYAFTDEDDIWFIEHQMEHGGYVWAYDFYEPHETLEGYEWIFLTTEFRFFDQSARAHGATWMMYITHYGISNEPRPFAGITIEDNIARISEFNYYGEERTLSIIQRLQRTGWGVSGGAWNNIPAHQADNNLSILTNYAFMVPQGYDGLVLIFFNADNSPEHGEYYTISDLIDEDSIILRLRNNN